MNRTACQQLLNIETISAAFSNNRQDISDRIIACFYACYRDRFVQWAKITYRHYPVDSVEALANDSFTEGVLAFAESAGRGELYKSKATVKTILFHYFRNKLLGNLKKEKRLADKNKELTLLLSDNAGHNTGDMENDVNELRYESLRLALEKMSAADRQIIRWRHIEGKSHDEMAAILAITVPSLTNRLYRCMQRLRKLVDETDNKNS